MGENSIHYSLHSLGGTAARECAEALLAFGAKAHAVAHDGTTAEQASRVLVPGLSKVLENRADTHFVPLTDSRLARGRSQTR